MHVIRTEVVAIVVLVVICDFLERKIMMEKGALELGALKRLVNLT